MSDQAPERGYGLSENEIREIFNLAQSETWIALKKWLKQEAEKAGQQLRSFNTTEPAIRYMQGRLGALNELTNFVERDLREWYDSSAWSPKNRREGTAG